MDADTHGDSEIARKDREWAAKAETGATNQAAAHRMATGGGYGGTATGPRGPADPQAYRTPNNLRTSSGPRFSGRAVLAAFGILGVLLTVAIMAILAVRVLDGMSGTDSGEADGSAGDATDDRKAEPAPAIAPGVPVAPGVPGGAEIDPSGPTDAARTAACDAERVTIETAADAFEILYGNPPSSIDELVDSGYLRPDDDGFSHELSPEGTVVPTGECAPA